MLPNLTIYSGAPWEGKLAYSRVRRIGPHVWVAGTTASANGQVLAEGDVYGQTKIILQIIADALEKAGAKMTDVIRTRLYVTDISRWEEAGRAHAEVFAGIDPAMAMVEVSALINPAMLVEIELDAYVEG